MITIALQQFRHNLTRYSNKRTRFLKKCKLNKVRTAMLELGAIVVETIVSIDGSVVSEGSVDSGIGSSKVEGG